MHIKHVLKELFAKKLIDKQGNIPDFDVFFAFLDEHLEDRHMHKVLHHTDAAKGITFLVVADALIEHKPINIGINPGSANVIQLEQHNFAFPFSHGISDKQNFGFVIFFNIQELVDYDGEKVVKKGFSKEYLESLLAASPEVARAFAKNKVLRIQGNLPSSAIKYIGFRYNDGSMHTKIYKI